MNRKLVTRMLAPSAFACAIGTGSLAVASHVELVPESCENMTSKEELGAALGAELVLIDLVARPVAVDGAAAAFDIQSKVSEVTPLRAVVFEQCHGARLEVGLVDAAVPVRRSVDLTDVPNEARVRTLAVALAELVRTTRNAAEARALEVAREALRSEKRSAASAEPRQPPRTKSEHEPPGEEPASARVDPGRLRLNGGALAVLGAWGRGQSFAAELGASLGHTTRFRWSLEGSYARASVETVFGDLGVERWGLALGGDLGFRDAPGLLIGPRAFLVELLARGDSIVDVEEDLQSGPGAAVGVRVSFEVPVAESWFVRSTLDAGVAVWSMAFTAGGHDAFVYRGPQAAWGIGVGWNP
jgi:hypothetical protein